mgnify:CR=1 FL=1
MEVEEDVVLTEACTNCCSNKSGIVFNPTRTLKGCGCLSGSWAVPCEGIKDIEKDDELDTTTETKESECTKKSCPSGELFDSNLCECVSTLVDTCNF